LRNRYGRHSQEGDQIISAFDMGFHIGASFGGQILPVDRLRYYHKRALI
jgi:hypothetical protein